MENLARALAARLGAEFQMVEKADDLSGPDRLKNLLAITRELAKLRKGDLEREKLKLAREALELKKAQTKEAMEAKFKEWMKRPETIKEFRPPPLSEAEMENENDLRKIMGWPELRMEPKAAVAAAAPAVTAAPAAGAAPQTARDAVVADLAARLKKSVDGMRQEYEARYGGGAAAEAPEGETKK